jgi:long-chain fatty acid transport protein
MVSDKLALLFDADYEDWSHFSGFGIELSTVGANTIISEGDFKWDDTWHVGAAFLYELGDNLYVSSGVGYDSSPVDDDDRILFLPVDEQVKFSMAVGKIYPKGLSYSLGFTGIWLGNGKLDQTVQGVRVKGQFDTNYVAFVGGQLEYTF